MISSSFDFVFGTDNNVLKGICAGSESFVNMTPLSVAKPNLEFTNLIWNKADDTVWNLIVVFCNKFYPCNFRFILGETMEKLVKCLSKQQILRFLQNQWTTLVFVVSLLFLKSMRFVRI